MMHTRIGTDINKAIELLTQDEVVAIPTETVYGLAANALSGKAVLKIFETKERPQFNPLIVHIRSWEEVSRYASAIPDIAHRLARKFVPGPLTFLLRKKEIIPDLVTAGSEFVAIRVPKHPLTQTLLEGLPFPIAAPSANQFGYISPTLPEHVMDSLGGKIPYILDGGPANVGLESTIIGFNEEEEVIVYRAGGLSVDSLEKEIGQTISDLHRESVSKPKSSGQLKSHYAPGIALYIGDIPALSHQFTGKRIASIQFKNRYPIDPEIDQYVLSADGDLNNAAAQLFKTMREIDQKDYDVILAEVFPSEGLGAAINDRLYRAQAIFKTE